MPRFTDEQITAISEAATLEGRDAASALLATVCPTPDILIEALAAAKAVRAGESVDLGDGEYLARDRGTAGGAVLGRTDVERDFGA
ncbi:hypothetical protein GCM10027176_45780 [Actinoallomurus bryophytorum]|uniref:Uncharacterized protein n=1 Tax=Actinoallomurus bryophytorum TaxID=1490222 RepID=A0A543CCP8_9ACTN|nr:hypothetical protein [Actinoallomurus bryophytorum]TQL94770.1 hypothetical protein FB559_0252 [Actinoallomurus bryophytorum]